jgi:hypothetical protein
MVCLSNVSREVHLRLRLAGRFIDCQDDLSLSFPETGLPTPGDNFYGAFVMSVARHATCMSTELIVMKCNIRDFY